jgi:hypothetical protein
MHTVTRLVDIQAELEDEFWNGTSVCRYAVASGAFAEPNAFASDAVKSAKAAKVVQELQLLGDGTYYRVSVAGTVRVFSVGIYTEDAIGSHACSFEALPCV